MKKYREPVIWLAALVALYVMEPSGTPSLCVFKAVGFSSCPGCGLGHAIHYALHLQWRASLQAHWLGIPATAFLILNIAKPFFPSYKHNAIKDEPGTAYEPSGCTT